MVKRKVRISVQEISAKAAPEKSNMSKLVSCVIRKSPVSLPCSHSETKLDTCVCMKGLDVRESVIIPVPEKNVYI